MSDHECSGERDFRLRYLALMDELDRVIVGHTDSMPAPLADEMALMASVAAFATVALRIVSADSRRRGQLPSIKELAAVMRMAPIDEAAEEAIERAADDRAAQ